MAEVPAKSGSSGSSAGLLLRVRHRGGQTDEFYLANGLTIGRTVANTVVLADDETAGRTHARVDFAADGSSRLRCVGPGNEISVGATMVKEIRLTAGVKFRIGKTDFECVSGRRGLGEERSSHTGCPLCGSQAVPPPSPDPVACTSCGRSILVLSLGTGHPAPIVVPVVYGQFQAERFVALGGMGLVMRGHATTDDRPVAIKLLLPDRDGAGQAGERFRQEIVMMERVRHTNVVRLLSHGVAGEFSFLVMEWVDGQTLGDVIADWRQRQRLPEFDRVLPWFDQVCKGLAAAHAVGLIHRDIKPSNILLARDSRVLLSDLGVAKRIDQGQTALTMTGQLPGTYEYMAPEQMDAPDTVDQRTDLYSLGVTFYELLTGERPVGAWLPASEVNSTVPSAFDQILSKLLARRPENRYEDIHGLLAAIAAFKQASVGGMMPAPAETRPPRNAAKEPSQNARRVAATVTPYHQRGLALIGHVWRRTTRYIGDLISGSDKSSGVKSKALVWYNTGCRFQQEGAYDDAITAFTEAIRLQPDFAEAYFNRGLAFAAKDDTYNAIRDYMNAIRLQPSYAEAYYSKGLAYARKGKLDKAIADYTEAIRLNPEFADAYFNRGIACCENGDADWAIADFTEAIRLDPESAWAYCNRGHAYSNRGDRDRAIADYTEAIRLNPDYGDAYLRRGVANAGGGNLEKAIADFTEAIRLDPEVAIAHFCRGLAYADEGDTDRATVDFTEAIRRRPDYAEAYHRRGCTYSINGDYDLAVADYSQAVRFNPDFADAYHGRGGVYYARGDHDLAIADYTKAIRLRPDDANAHFNRGVVHADKGDTDDAIADYTEAIRLQPEFADAYQARGHAYQEKGDGFRAEADFARANQLGLLVRAPCASGVDKTATAEVGQDTGDRSDEVHLDRGLVRLERRQYELAIADFNEAIRLRPDHAEAYYSRGIAYADKGDRDKAMADFTEAIRLQPNDAEAYCSRGSVYREEGEFERAISDFSEAIRLQTELGDAYYGRALAYQEKGEKNKAEADFARAKQLGYVPE